MTIANSVIRRRRGQSLIEFTFVGIPVIFLLISIFEISRGMWMYHTLSHSVEQGVRFAMAHGRNCGQNGNACLVTMGEVAQVIKCAGVGLDPNTTNLKFLVNGAQTGTTKTLNAYAGSALSGCVLNAGSGDTTVWPADDGSANLVGNTIEIYIETRFNSAIAMLWPGSRPITFTSTNMPASAVARIVY